MAYCRECQGVSDDVVLTGRSKDHTRIGSYAIAFAIGMAMTLWCFPLTLLLGSLPAPPDSTHPSGAIGHTDFLLHMTGQIYFFAQPWHWPMLQIAKFDVPSGVNIAMTDSIPLQAMMAKLLHPLFPSFRQGISAYQGFTWIMQPIAAVFALRSAGERRLLPAIAIAVMAISMPTFLLRMWHTALSGHYLLLIAIGLYFRATGPSARKAWLIALGGLCFVTLFLHPYLMVMELAILIAIPLGSALRRDGRWRASLATLLGTAIAIGGVGRILGYWGGSSEGGFRFFSMNLLSPVWPARSAFFPHAANAVADATGGQAFEGYQYLGAGLILALFTALCLARNRASLRRLSRRHVGLLIMMIGLTLFSLSNMIYLGHWKLIHVPNIYPGSYQLRSSGRMFWPIAYLLLVGGVAALARLRPPVATAALIACAAAQFADGQTLRSRDRSEQYALVVPAGAGPARLDALLASYRTLVVEPRIECQGPLAEAAMPIIYLAALRGMPTNSAYAARVEPASACGAPATLGSSTLQNGELGAAMGNGAATQAAFWQQTGATCGILDGRLFCSTSGSGLSGLPKPVFRPIPVGQTLPLGETALRDRLLGPGWSTAEPWGVWNVGPIAYLALPASALPQRLMLVMRSITLPHHEIQQVTMRIGSNVIAHVPVGDQNAPYTITVPPRPNPSQPIFLRLDISHPYRLQHDPRLFGIALISARLDRMQGKPARASP